MMKSKVETLGEIEGRWLKGQQMMCRKGTDQVERVLVIVFYQNILIQSTSCTTFGHIIAK